MSGLAGIWHRDRRPVDGAVLARMSAQLSHRSDDEGRWVQGAAGLTGPLAEAPGAAVIFDGRLDNREELVALLASRGNGVSAASPDPALVLAAYHEFGEQTPERLAGDFAFAIADPGRQQLLLARDAIGIRPLHYHVTPRLVAFASQIKALLAHPDVPAVPQEDLLADFLLDRTYDSSLTFFRGIESLAPAHCAMLTPGGGWRVRRYWDFDPRHELHFESFEACGEAFRELFACAVRRRMRSASPVAVSVSGGLDSSAIFCMAGSLAGGAGLVGVSAASLHESPANETAMLDELQRRQATPVHRIGVNGFRFLEGQPALVSATETPLLDTQWAVTSQVWNTARAGDARVLLTGQWGDHVLSPFGHLVDLGRQGRWRTLAAQLDILSSWMTDVEPAALRRHYLKSLLSSFLPDALFLSLRRARFAWRKPMPWYAAGFRSQALRHQRRRVALGTGRWRSMHARSLYAMVRSGYHVLCMEWNHKAAAAQGLEIAFPFLDRDVLEFLMAIDGEWVSHGGVPKALLRSALKEVLPEPIAQRRWKADFTVQMNAAVDRDAAALGKLIHAGGRAAGRGYLDGASLAASVPELCGRLKTADTALTAWALADMAGLELWLQTFFPNSCARSPSLSSR